MGGDILPKITCLYGNFGNLEESELTEKERLLDVLNVVIQDGIYLENTLS